MEGRRQTDGDWEDQQPLGKHDLDRILSGKLTRKERRRLYRILEECGLCLFEE